MTVQNDFSKRAHMTQKAAEMSFFVETLTPVNLPGTGDLGKNSSTTLPNLTYPTQPNIIYDVSK